MSGSVTVGATSWTCTCTHGGGGHAPACQLFVPTKEDYARVTAERDRLRAEVEALREDCDLMRKALETIRENGVSGTEPMAADHARLVLSELVVSYSGS